MKVLFAASECVPFIKTGGLADVVGTLPVSLAKLGIDVRVIIPRYRDIPQHLKEEMQPLQYFYINLGWRRQYCGIDMIKQDGVTYYFVDNEFYFGRDSVYGSGNEEGERFAFFSKVVMESLPHLGFKPDIIHCHDWQTGMIPTLLKTQYRHNNFYKEIKTIYTIHNLRYQGVFDWAYIQEILGIGNEYFSPNYLEYYGCINFMKGGIVFSEKISTVSPSYAKEIQTAYYGEKLDGLLCSRRGDTTGILNGIDINEYDSQKDIWLPAHFSENDFSGKAICKADLQKELGLEQRAEVPIIAIISRLTNQKGIDLVEHVLDEIMRNDVQLVILGKGDENYEELFSWAAWRYNGRIATRIELNNALSHRIYASADMFLMPSQFEPCGLSQMISMRYGTIPIVRETGGLIDSVSPYNKFTDEGNGFAFANYNAHEMLTVIEMALAYFAQKDVWKRLMQRAMRTKLSWDDSAKQYEQMYVKLSPKNNAIKPTKNIAKPAAKTKAKTTALPKAKPTKEAKAQKEKTELVAKATSASKAKVVEIAKGKKKI